MTEQQAIATIEASASAALLSELRSMVTDRADPEWYAPDPLPDPPYSMLEALEDCETMDWCWEDRSMRRAHRKVCRALGMERQVQPGEIVYINNRQAKPGRWINEKSYGEILTA